MDKRKDIDLKAVKARLEARREELHHLAETSAESRKPVELDQTRVGRLSRMDALQDQAMQLETERRRQIELQRIEATSASTAPKAPAAEGLVAPPLDRKFLIGG
jgi:DnaK suppressor protein